ncbi:hypothetical protein GMLC_28050 [Geomonas limicola]|uniref:Uncharacterized protein n=1 Tax=Geomonas limicola TaxID=2740186 RepID=A0A6V8N9F8_9BACT|nr:hypothetical protein GMLC_28050 [Geomonas limicola]
MGGDLLTLAYIGNIGHVYDFETLLDVMIEKKGSMRLFIVGDGDRREWLITRLQEHQLPHKYFGPVYDPSLLSEIFAQCDAGFNGYKNTSAAFSYKANSYFAAGLPILNSMTGDLETLVAEQGLGFNYNSGDVASLAKAVANLTEGDSQFLRRNVATFFESELDLDRVKESLENFFRIHFSGLQRPQ